MKKTYFIIIFLVIGVIFVYTFKKNDTVKEFISKYGWIIDEKSAIIEETKIPEKFEGAVSDYDAMLKKAGFNLEKYKGKTLKRYSYQIKNHKEQYAQVNVFTYKNKIAFADVVVPRIDGYMHNIDEVKYQNAS